ncbi:hypothetical protein Mal15_03950 [Stieleria maiorica]|uniref:Uncharacterized protein n=1 Tax=Stieleria maiorica TaxID=2795974 RepID=A0A5B9M595_9BACT|nr:hypothetical protein Mal15_03950 [Stieleria maiorica]
MGWILIASVFFVSFLLVLNSVRVALLDDRLDLRESRLVRNLAQARRRYSSREGMSQRKSRSGRKSGNTKFPPVPGMGSFTAT